MEREVLSLKNKALKVNLNPAIYGTIAEIGGGQEVARSFFQAGGASGTIAKSISAYDKTFSDALYNNYKTGRYVSQNRLEKMLSKEFNELTKLLAEKRSNETLFFTFANTVETINFAKTNQGHGWLGVRFQLKPGEEPNQVIIHVRLHEKDTLLQQYTIGTIGVNLIYACFYYWEKPNVFLQSLMDNLSTDRVEINMAEMNGPELNFVDNRLLSVQLVKNGMTDVTIFDRNGQVQSASDLLYKKDVLVFRGSFRPITYVGFDMLKTSFSLFKKDIDYDKTNAIVLCEITLNNLLDEGDFDERDFLARVDILNGMGQNVMISNFKEFYKLIDYLNNFKISNLRLLIGLPTLNKVLNEDYYVNLKGGILEAFGRLFSQNLKVYAYPAIDKNNKIKTLKNAELSPKIESLFKYLVDNGKLIDIPGFKKEWLHFSSHEVLKKIKKGDNSWIQMVPKYVSDKIKEKKLFGCNTNTCTQN